MRRSHCASTSDSILAEEEAPGQRCEHDAERVASGLRADLLPLDPLLLALAFS